MVSHQFNPTPFFKEYQDRKVIQDKVWELHNKGWGYTKIHHYLVDNNYDIGKSRTTVDSMIKKRIKRERFLNQEIRLDTYVDFGLEVYRDWLIIVKPVGIKDPRSTITSTIVVII